MQATVAGRALEVASGASYEEVVRALVLEPLGLRGARFERDASLAAEGHQLGAGGLAVVGEAELPRAVRCILGLSCSVVDALAYLAALLPRTRATRASTLDATRGQAPDAVTPPLQTSSARVEGAPGTAVLRELLRPGPGPTPPPDGQALAWRIEVLGGCAVALGGGAVRGQVSALVLVPERDFGLVVLANSAVATGLLERVKRRALADPCGVTLPPADRTPAAAEAWRAALGRYQNPTHDFELLEQGGERMLAMTIKRAGFPHHTVDARAELPPVPCALYRDGRIAVLPETPFERWGRLLPERDGARYALMHARAHLRCQS